MTLVHYTSAFFSGNAWKRRYQISSSQTRLIIVVYIESTDVIISS